jgi:Arc/MetJ-type ribon-helix-helix transcriptional regulator
MSLTLSVEQEHLVQAQIATGQFQTPAQVIDAALDLLELGEAALPVFRTSAEVLRHSVTVGLAQAERGDFTLDEDVQTMLGNGTRKSIP